MEGISGGPPANRGPRRRRLPDPGCAPSLREDHSTAPSGNESLTATIPSPAMPDGSVAPSGIGAGGILQASGADLHEMQKEPYESEDVLQRALEERPEVIAGSSTTDSQAGRLLLVKREMGVPDSAGGPSVWSLRHLFLDAEGVPVVVEVKRSFETRIGRELVGQLLVDPGRLVQTEPTATRPRVKLCPTRTMREVALDP